MKKYAVQIVVVLGMLFLFGCASSIPSGVFYTDVKLPAGASEAQAGSKIGKSYCKSYCGVVAIGDASIEAAKANGGITKVSSVDWKAKSVLGIIGEYECIVRGE